MHRSLSTWRNASKRACASLHRCLDSVGSWQHRWRSLMEELYQKVGFRTSCSIFTLSESARGVQIGILLHIYILRCPSIPLHARQMNRNGCADQPEEKRITPPKTERSRQSRDGPPVDSRHMSKQGTSGQRIGLVNVKSRNLSDGWVSFSDWECKRSDAKWHHTRHLSITDRNQLRFLLFRKTGKGQKVTAKQDHDRVERQPSERCCNASVLPVKTHSHCARRHAQVTRVNAGRRAGTLTNTCTNVYNALWPTTAFAIWGGQHRRV